jgi:hypothetical protein
LQPTVKESILEERRRKDAMRPENSLSSDVELGYATLRDRRERAFLSNLQF